MSDVHAKLIQLVGDVIVSAMDLERECGANAGMDLSHSAWVMHKAAHDALSAALREVVEDAERWHQLLNFQWSFYSVGDLRAKFVVHMPDGDGPEEVIDSVRGYK